MPNENQIDELANSFVSVLNRNGYGFHYSVIKKAKELVDSGKSQFWFEASEFPVEVQGANTRIDFILKKMSDGGKWLNTVFMVAECKRVNPAYSNWCFIKSPFTNRNYPVSDNKLIIETLLRDDEEDGKILNFARKDFYIENSYHIGFEARANKPGDSKGETGQAIENAATQVLRGMNGFIQTMNKENHIWKKSYKASFLPVIFTTADLVVSDVDISTANLQTGEISIMPEQVKTVPWLYYQYSMSPGLKHSINSKEETREISELLIRDYLRTIPIVSANGVEDFLTTVSSNKIEGY